MPELNVRQRTKRDKATGVEKKYGWEYRFEAATVGGKRQQISKGGFRTKKEAIAAGNAAIAEYENAGLHIKQTEMSVADYFDLWMKEYCEVNLKQTTIVNYRKRIENQIKPTLGGYKLRHLNAATIQSQLNKWFEEGYSRNSLTAFKGILSGALDYAVITLQIIKDNPAARCKLPLARAKPKTTETRSHARVVVPKETMDQVFKRFPEGHPAHLPLMLGYRCGLRLGEAFAVSFDDIDFDKGTLTVKYQVQMDEKVKLWQLVPPKYDSVRTIRLDDGLLRELERAHKRTCALREAYGDLYTVLRINHTGHITTDENGTEWHPVNIREDGSYCQPRIMQHTFRVIHGKDAEGDPPLHYDFDFHSLRHTHTTQLIAAGANPIDVKERLGHKNIETTLGIYAHNSEALQDQTVELMNKLYK